MRALLSAVLIVALAGCVDTNSHQDSKINPGTPYSLSGSELRVVKRDVSASMKDPESARFGEIFAAKGEDGVVTVCGYVNGKNSYGGYVGPKPFLGALVGGNSRFILVDIGSTDISVLADISTCRKYGVAI